MSGKFSQFGLNSSNFERHCFMSGHSVRRWKVLFDGAGLSELHPIAS